MRTLARAIKREDAGGAKLPPVFTTFTGNGIDFRRGGLHMVAGVPGAAKTTLAMTIAAEMRLPTLYVVPDSDERTIATRYIVRATGMQLWQAEKLVDEDPEAAAGYMKEYSHIRWMYESGPSPRDIQDALKAFTEAWGESPHLTVVDNLMDVDVNVSGESHHKLMAASQALKFLARDFNTALLALHHTSEAVRGNPICQPRSAVQGKVNQLPSLILTIAQTDGWLYVCPVKNRYAWDDETGFKTIRLRAALAHMRITDPE